MLKKTGMLLMLAGVLIGCATSSIHRTQELGVSYTDLYMGDHTYVMVAGVDGDAEESAAYEYFQRRAVEIMRQKGYRKFEMVERGASGKRYSILTKKFIDTNIDNVSTPYVYTCVKFYKR